MAKMDQDKPFIIEDKTAKPFPVLFKGVRYELPGEVPVSMLEQAVKSVSEGASEQQIGAAQVVAFLSEVCPPALRDELRKAGASALNSLFEGWSEFVGLGEILASWFS